MASGFWPASGAALGAGRPLPASPREGSRCPVLVGWRPDPFDLGAVAVDHGFGVGFVEAGLAEGLDGVGVGVRDADVLAEDGDVPASCWSGTVHDDRRIHALSVIRAAGQRMPSGG